MNDHVSESIQSTIDSNDVVLFMKGSKEMPQCGFSNAVVNALSYLDVKFEDVDVLQNDIVIDSAKLLYNPLSGYIFVNLKLKKQDSTF